MASSPSFIATPKTPVVSFANADGTAFKSVFTGGSLGSRLDSISVSNSDTVNAYVIQFAMQKSGIDYVLGEVSIPLGAGTNGTAKSVAALNPTDIPALTYTESNAMYLESGAILRARVKSAVAGSSTVQLVGIGGDY
jgi:hypothetical protein